jgi:hypothetical protein
VRVRTNLYSVPAEIGKTVEVRLYPSWVEVRDEGRCVAQHERCYERHQQVLELEHYLDVLEREPGALAGSKPLAAWRQRGRWPASYDRLLDELIRRHGKQSGTRQKIQVLSLIKQYGHARVRIAVEKAITWAVRTPPQSGIWQEPPIWFMRAARSSSWARCHALNGRCR